MIGEKEYQKVYEDLTEKLHEMDGKNRGSSY
jgi:hypothetical protein